MKIAKFFLILVVVCLAFLGQAQGRRYATYGRDPMIRGGLTLEQARARGITPFQLEKDRYFEMRDAHGNWSRWWHRAGTWMGLKPDGIVIILACGNETTLVVEKIPPPPPPPPSSSVQNNELSASAGAEASSKSESSAEGGNATSIVNNYGPKPAIERRVLATTGRENTNAGSLTRVPVTSVRQSQNQEQQQQQTQWQKMKQWMKQVQKIILNSDGG